jgi:hypothetical protein
MRNVKQMWDEIIFGQSLTYLCRLTQIPCRMKLDLLGEF